MLLLLKERDVRHTCVLVTREFASLFVAKGLLRYRIVSRDRFITLLHVATTSASKFLPWDLNS